MCVLRQKQNSSKCASKKALGAEAENHIIKAICFPEIPTVGFCIAYFVAFVVVAWILPWVEPEHQKNALH